MALRNIVKIGDPMLKKTSRPVEKFDERLSQLIDDMKETMYEAQGCGLAAVQVGVLRRVVVVDVGDGFLELVNPEIIYREGEQQAEEGCLSLLGGPRKTKRYEKIKVQYQTLDFQTRLKTYTGWTAQIIQHEIDHCNGVLI